MNPFSPLDVSYEEDESTDNPERKLAKMKRRYEKNPRPDLKKRIDEMNNRLNSKPKPKKKKKKKVDDFDLDNEVKENSKRWKEYHEKEREERERKEKEEREERERKEKEEREERERKQKEWKRKQKEWEEQKKDREREKETSKTSFYLNYKQRKSLPKDIQNFISKPPDKKMYNKLCKIYHPDKGGDQEMFKILNNHMN